MKQLFLFFQSTCLYTMTTCPLQTTHGILRVVVHCDHITYAETEFMRPTDESMKSVDSRGAREVHRVYQLKKERLRAAEGALIAVRERPGSLILSSEMYMVRWYVAKYQIPHYLVVGSTKNTKCQGTKYQTRCIYQKYKFVRQRIRLGSQPSSWRVACEREVDFFLAPATLRSSP